MAKIIIGKNPFDVSDLVEFTIKDNLTIAEFLDAETVKFSYPTLCFLNSADNVLLRDEWASTRLSAADKVLFIPLVQGGGGGGGSNPVKIILGIALMIFAPGLATMLGGTGGLIGAAGIAKFGAALLLSAFSPVQKPPAVGQSFDIKEASPTYSLSAQGNSNRLGAAIPKIYGKHLTFPSYASQPWATYFNNKQHLIQIFLVGHGTYDLSEIKIEDTPIAQVTNVNWAHLRFDENNQMQVVAASTGIPNLIVPLAGTGGYHTPDGPYPFIETYQTWHNQVVNATEVSGQVLYATNEADRPTDGWVGGFVLNKSGSEVNALQLDFVCQRGLYYANDNGSFTARSVTWEAQARKINDKGLPLADWVGLMAATTITGSDSKSGLIKPVYKSGFNWNPDLTIAVYDPVTTTLVLDLGVKGTASHNFSTSTAKVLSWSLDTSGATDKITVTATASTESAYVQSILSGGDAYIGSLNGIAIEDNPWFGTVKVDFTYSYQKIVTSPTVTAATNEVQQWTTEIPIPPGRYEVRVRRTDAKDLSTRAGHEIRLAGLKGITTTQPDYSGCTLLYTRMEATDKLSQQASRKINCVAQALLPIWDGSQWTPPTATRSPAWAMADVMRATYSGMLGDDKFSTAELRALAITCEDRGDYFDFVADQQMTVFEMLQKIGKAVRAVPVIRSGILRVVRDQIRPLPVAVFTPDTITKNSLAIELVMPGERTGDWVEVEYFDRETWAWRTITVGAKPPVIYAKPIKLRIDGVTEEAQARREAIYLVATNTLRRQFVTFSTEMDGFIPSYGDLISVVHEMPGWGQSAAVLSYSESGQVVVDTMLTWGSGQHYAAFRKKDGSLSTPYAVSKGTGDNVMLLDGLAALLIEIGGLALLGVANVATACIFGGSQALAKDLVVLGIRPRSATQVEVTGVVENVGVHTADAGY